MFAINNIPFSSCIMNSCSCICEVLLPKQSPENNDQMTRSRVYLIDLEVCAIEWEAPSHCCSAWYLQ